ncbi:MAG: 3-hydroxyacyl-CoA dehydrogenase/enoyl-CoA hydratase family protein [Planctomycetota bacterium]|nr:MAG: 3-hydroxyacyl-CoA dehydrogenase/enoyl-CoA hydratase family protein [Planctomycetota bacterium]
MRAIQTVAVLGAGVMGSGIAAQLAGAGIRCYLFDIVPEGAEDRNILPKTALKKLTKHKPALLYSKRDLKRIVPANLEDDLDKLKKADWVIEAVVEKLEVKKSLFSKIQSYLKEGAIVSSNTSGISLAAMVEGMEESFQQRFLITHFFNPVRYLRLLEIVSGEKTLPEVVQTIADFGEHQLGKGIVYAKDTPNFIANRIGVYAKMLTIHEMIAQKLRIEDIDAAFGTLLGRPKSAVFRTADMVGLDTTSNVVNYLYSVLENDPEREVFRLPDFYKKMLENGWLGQKAKCGFYKVEKTQEGKKILTLDWEKMEYREKVKPDYTSLRNSKDISDLAKRIRHFLLDEDDILAKVARKITLKCFWYAASLIPEISDDIVNIDRALKWGYNWQIGLFETWDILGLEKTVELMREEGWEIPENVEKLLKTEQKKFYWENKYFDFLTATYKELDVPSYQITLASLTKEKTVYKNPSASLIDLEDGILCLEIHTEPLNMIDDGVVEATFRAVEEAEKNFCGIVVANQGENFCVGANLMMLGMAAMSQNWDDIARMVDHFQKANQALKYSKVPVVAAPFGMTLGGGAELAMAANHIHASVELYMGLVEVGVGLIPAGGGCLNMLKRYLANIPSEVVIDKTAILRHLFEIVGMAKVSTSAKEAKDLKFLESHHTYTLNKDKLIYEAKQIALGMAKGGYRPEEPWEEFTLPGIEGYPAFKYGLHAFKETGVITEYDAVVGDKLAYVLCGGNVSPRSKLSEQHILDLEKEAFLSLCGMEGTLARIQHMLQHKKPLRN